MRFKEFYKLFVENMEIAIIPTNDDYHGEHTSPTPETGAPLFDLTLNGTFPPDVYQTISHYLCGAEGENQMVSMIFNYKGSQKASIKVYRAVPKDSNVRINEGDWVTPIKSYARDHGRSALNNNYKIIEKTVKTRDIYTNGDSLMEWGYHKTPFNNEYDTQRKKDKFTKLIIRLNNGEKIFKINQNPEDKWTGKESEYVEYLYKRMPYLKD